ncbi:MAG: thiamine ABC transporter substrate-binding protein [Halobacteriota archaeon]
MSHHRHVSRRSVLAGLGSAVSLGSLAGCVGNPVGDEPDTLRVGTYQAYVDAPSTSAGEWVKTEFEDRYDYTLEWVVRENELTDFIQRRQEGAPLEADAYLGVTAQDLVKADANLDDPLFTGFETDEIANAANIEDHYHFDPDRRVLPTGASYVAIVYDETVVDAPPTFDALRDPAYEDQLLLANPQSTATGLLFLLWTVNTVGADSYLGYWQDLMDNGVTVLGSWSSAYNAYLQEEAAMVVSYSTDQVYAASEGQDMARHQIAFPNDQGYAYVDGLGKFATTDRHELVQTFADFMLEPDVQRKTAVDNVGIPTVSNATLPEDIRQYAHVPDEPVQLSYDVLAEHMTEWRDAWAEQVATN